MVDVKKLPNFVRTSLLVEFKLPKMLKFSVFSWMILEILSSFFFLFYVVLQLNLKI